MNYLSIFTCAIALSGCAVNPLARQFPATNTLDVVGKIRCEVRDALVLQLIRYLGENGNSKTRKLSSNLERLFHTDPFAFETLLKNLGEKQVNTTSFRQDLGFTPKEHDATLTSLIGSTITYTYNFDITYQNKSGIGFGFKPRFGGGTTSMMDFKLGSDLSRKGVRSFTFTDNLGDYQALQCYPEFLGEAYERKIISGSNGYIRKKPSPNGVYPIRGHTGIANSINNYIQLILSRRNARSGLGSYSDSFTFTTKFNGDIDPTITYSPISNSLNLSTITGKFGSSETSIHKVSVALSPPDKPKEKTEDLEIAIGGGVKIVVDVPVSKFSKQVGVQRKARDGSRRKIRRSSKVKSPGKLLRESGLTQEQVDGGARRSIIESNRIEDRDQFKRTLRELRIEEN